MPALQKGEAAFSREERLQRAISLLEQALELLDQAGDQTEVGARLAALIDALNDNVDD